MDVGVIGVGSMGINHARVLSEISNLVGVSDTNEQIGKRVASRFHTEYYSDYLELIKQVDAISLATPTMLHHPMGMKILDQGIHVLIEKPLASTLEQAMELVRKSDEEQLVLATGHIERYNPVINYLKGLTQSGELGMVISLSSKRVSSFPERIKDVGVLMDLGIHDIDIQRFIANSEPVSVYALGGKTDRDRSEDHANILLGFENGIKGFIEINWLTPLKVRKLYLTCTKKYVECDYINQTAEISSSSYGELDESNLFKVPLEFDSQLIQLTKQEPLKNELEDFLNAVSTGKQPLVTGQDGVEAIRIADAAITSLATGNKIDMTTYKIA